MFCLRCPKSVSKKLKFAKLVLNDEIINNIGVLPLSFISEFIKKTKEEETTAPTVSGTDEQYEKIINQYGKRFGNVVFLALVDSMVEDNAV